MARISDRENQQIDAARTSGKTPVVFIHGLWLLPSSWANWAEFFKQAGYAPLTPDWPDDPETVQQARATPDVFARKTLQQVADHATGVITALNQKPVVMGHSTGGLLAQMLAGRGLSTATVAIDPGPLGAAGLALRLRLGTPSVIARIENDRVLLDPRTLPEDELNRAAEAVSRALQQE